MRRAIITGLLVLFASGPVLADPVVTPSPDTTTKVAPKATKETKESKKSKHKRKKAAKKARKKARKSHKTAVTPAPAKK